MTNEAAAWLCSVCDRPKRFHSDKPAHSMHDWHPFAEPVHEFPGHWSEADIENALDYAAYERRATVERIRELANAHAACSKETCDLLLSLYAVLDEEAAR